MWMPSLTDRSGPKYLRITDALADAVKTGSLAGGERLPTHRELAWRLGVTVGTVTRAYAEAERRGLVVGEVGRGSFVRPAARSTASLAMPEEGHPQAIDLGMNRPPIEAVAGSEFAEVFEELSRSNRLLDLVNYQPQAGRLEHRAAVSAWLERRGLDVAPEAIVLTSGAQHAIAAALMAFADAGEPVLVDELTWSGTRAVASLLRLTLRGLPMDGEGVLPDALDAACRSGGVGIYYTTPTIHNPTTAVMSAERRRAVAEIARRHDLLIVEDNVYADMEEGAPPPLASFAPERTIYIGAVSKSMAPALRVGFAAMPVERLTRFIAAARASNWMAPPLMSEIAARWMADGTAESLLARIREESRQRQLIAAAALDGLCYRSRPTAFHVWLTLPEPWRSQEVVSAAALRGITLTPTELFVAGRGETPHCLRVALTSAPSRTDLERGLGVLRDLLLHGRPEPVLAVA